MYFVAFSDRPSQSPSGSSEPARRAGRHAKSHWSGGTIAAVVLAVVVILSGLGVLLANQTNKPWPPTGNVPAAAKSGSRSTAQPAANDTPPAAAALAACHAVWAAQSAALRAAQRSMRQWQVHVDAMNQLVSGKITLAQASAFWAKTRIGAAHRVRVFERTDRSRQAVPQHCAPAAGSPATPTITACMHGIQARDNTLAAAERAITTWNGHIADMEMLRMGKMSPTMASRMWIRSWHRGQRQIDSYAAMVRQVQGMHC